jgi:uncharacterized membrane protein
MCATCRDVASWQWLYAAMRMSKARLIGLGFVFLWFFVGGIAHFAATNLEMRIVPPYIPWPYGVVLVSGVFELLGAFGLLVGRTRRVAGIGLFLLTIAVTPAHIYMLQRADLFAVPYWALVLRLPLQVGLLALIAWSTAPLRLDRDGS